MRRGGASAARGPMRTWAAAEHRAAGWSAAVGVQQTPGSAGRSAAAGACGGAEQHGASGGAARRTVGGAARRAVGGARRSSTRRQAAAATSTCATEQRPFPPAIHSKRKETRLELFSGDARPTRRERPADGERACAPSAMDSCSCYAAPHMKVEACRLHRGIQRRQGRCINKHGKKGWKDHRLPWIGHRSSGREVEALSHECMAANFLHLLIGLAKSGGGYFAYFHWLGPHVRTANGEIWMES